MDVLNPASPNNVFNEDLCAFNAQRLRLNAGMRLMPRHGCGAVVHNNQCEFMVVVNSIDESCYSGMEKGGIADEGDHLLVSGLEKPHEELTEAPIQITKSAIERGGSMPRV